MIFADSRLTFYAIGCVLVNVYGETFYGDAGNAVTFGLEGPDGRNAG